MNALNGEKDSFLDYHKFSEEMHWAYAELILQA